MTINELSKLSHVKTETIRSYRLKGLLKPHQNPVNKYYEYSETDLYHLLFIRKLREINMSLDSIQYAYNRQDMSELQSEYEKEKQRIDHEILQLERQKRMMELTINHLKECETALASPTLIHSYDERIDCFDLGSKDPILEQWLEHKSLFTQSLRIPASLLTSQPLPEEIPLQCGIGCYRSLLEEYGLSIPEKAVVYPDGEYVAFTVELDRLDHIKKEQLLPLLDFVKAHHYEIVGDTTAFLYQVTPTEEGCRLHYRMRVMVRPLSGSCRP
ncbi:MAG: MerR family transcriptional regulator [Lachnospiraceae bacterium]|nr:MerR family transcriptional regulator [Lachnospiraceae bacterium]